jgi:hypothetical protein
VIGLEPPNTAFFAASWLAPTRSAGLIDFAQCWGNGARRGHNGGPQGPLCHWLMAAETSPGCLARRRLDRTRATARRKSTKASQICLGLSVVTKNGAILAGLWPCFRWQTLSLHQLNERLWAWMLVAVGEGAKMAGPQGPLCHRLMAAETPPVLGVRAMGVRTIDPLCRQII